MSTAHGRFDELRTGFTAAVSHELRTPLARILALLDSADLPGADVHALIDAGARRGRERRRPDRRDPLPLGARERPRGRRARPHDGAARCSRTSSTSLDDSRGARRRRARSRRRPDASTCRSARGCCASSRENLAENAIRYAGHGARFTFSVHRAGAFVVLTAADDGVGVPSRDTRRASSNASTAPTPRAPRAAPGSGSRSSSTSSSRRAARSRRTARRGRGLRIRATFPA